MSCWLGEVGEVFAELRNALRNRGVLCNVWERWRRWPNLRERSYGD